MPVQVGLVVEADLAGEGANDTHDLFTTGHVDANRAAVRAVATANLDLVGIALSPEIWRVLHHPSG